MTAQRTAATLTSGDAVPWRSLERSAFEDFPEVVAQLHPSSGAGQSNRRLLYFVPLALLVAVIYGTPIWGLVTVVGPWGLSQTSRTAEGDITVGGIIFGVALVSLLVHTALWLWSGRPSKTALGGSSGMAFFLGGISVGVTAMRGIGDAVPDWGLWILPMVACTVIGGIVFFLVRQVRRRASITEKPLVGGPGARVSPEHLQAVRETITRVADEDQALIRADLAAAIDDLERREVITAADAGTARSAELGELASRMA